MKIQKIILTFFIVIISFVCKGQDGINKERSYIVVERKNKPLIYTSHLIMKKGRAISQHFVRNEESYKLYGDKGKNGILVVTLDEKTTLLSLQQLFDLFNVPASDRILPVVVDDRYVKNPDNLIAVKEDIEYVKSEVHWHTKQKVLYIRSIRPLPTRSEQYRSIGK